MLTEPHPDVLPPYARQPVVPTGVVEIVVT
jgi:hypothetical protein